MAHTTPRPGVRGRRTNEPPVTRPNLLRPVHALAEQAPTQAALRAARTCPPFPFPTRFDVCVHVPVPDLSDSTAMRCTSTDGSSHLHATGHRPVPLLEMRPERIHDYHAHNPPHARMITFPGAHPPARASPPGAVRPASGRSGRRRTGCQTGCQTGWRRRPRRARSSPSGSRRRTRPGGACSSPPMASH